MSATRFLAGLLLAVFMCGCDMHGGPMALDTDLAGQVEVAAGETVEMPIDLFVTTRGLGDDVNVFVSAYVQDHPQVIIPIQDSSGVDLPRSDRLADESATHLFACEDAERPRCQATVTLVFQSQHEVTWDWRFRAYMNMGDFGGFPDWSSIEAQLR